MRPVFVLLAGCVCGAAAAAAAVDSDGGPGRLREIPLAQLSARAEQARATAGEAQRTRPGGVNRHVQPAASRARLAREAAPEGADVYIVRLRDLPVATYDGRVPGYAATARSAQRAESKTDLWLDRGRAAIGLGTTAQRRADAYRSYLRGRQRQALDQLRSRGLPSQARAQFTQAINGFTLRASAREA